MPSFASATFVYVDLEVFYYFVMLFIFLLYSKCGGKVLCCLNFILIYFTLRDFGQSSHFPLSCASSFHPFPPDQKIACTSGCECDSINLVLNSPPNNVESGLAGT